MKDMLLDIRVVKNNHQGVNKTPNNVGSLFALILVDSCQPV